MDETEVIEGSGEPAEPSAEQAEQPSKLAEAGISQEDLENAVPLEGLDPHDHKALVGIDHFQDIKLKKKYANWLLWLITIQLVVADAVFVAYAWAGEHWHLEAGVIQIWLVATLVELIGVALVITRYLFPRRDRQTPSP
ncbi:MAG: hypothetical protein ACTHN7_01245 [Solirubrobacterales bacterium]